MERYELFPSHGNESFTRGGSVIAPTGYATCLRYCVKCTGMTGVTCSINITSTCRMTRTRCVTRTSVDSRSGSVNCTRDIAITSRDPRVSGAAGIDGVICARCVLSC